jgi:hypothetical protein
MRSASNFNLKETPLMRFMKHFVRVLALVICVSIPHALAQSAGTGALTGTVTDPTGGVISGTTVTVTNTGTNQSRTATTGSDGSYRITLLPPGAYNVKFSASGFKTSEVPSVVIDVTQTPGVREYSYAWRRKAASRRQQWGAWVL